MAGTKYLNLDEIAPEVNRVIRLGGTEYPIVLQTVGAFIKGQEMAAEIDKAGNEADSMKLYINMLGELIPTMPEDILHKLTFEQLQSLAEFARGEVDDEVKEEMAKTAATEELSPGEDEELKKS